MKGVGTEFYEDDIKSAESFIIDNVNLFDLQKMVHHYLIIYNLGLQDEEFQVESYLDNGTLEISKSVQ